MAQTFGKRRYRVLVDAAVFDPLDFTDGRVDPSTHDAARPPLRIYPGNDLQIEAAFAWDYANALEFLDLTGYSTLSCVIKPMPNSSDLTIPPTPGAAYVMLNAVSPTAVTVATAGWEAGTAHHAVFNFTDAESAVTAGHYWMVFTGVTTAGDLVTFRGARVDFAEAAAGTSAAVTPADPFLTGVAWGDITGTLANQTDLQSALDAKADANGYMPGAVVRVATTSNISNLSSTLANGTSLNGVTLATGDLVLARNQTVSPETNGIYLVGASSGARAPGFDTWDELVGCMVVVTEGTTYAGTVWFCDIDAGGTLETTSIAFVRVPVASTSIQCTSNNILIGNASGAGANAQELTASSARLLLGLGSAALAATDDFDAAGAAAAVNATLSSHTSNTSNPHSVTKSQVGLGNVDNTSDASKGSNPTATAGESAVNGSASTFMRSDAAPAVAAATTSTKGIIELATTAEVAAGTSASLVAPISTLQLGLMGSPLIAQIAHGSNLWTAVVTGTGSTTRNDLVTTVNTGATAGSTALARTQGYANLCIAPAFGTSNQGAPDWSKRTIVAGFFGGLGQGTTNGIRRFSVGKTTSTGMGNLATRGVGLVLIGNSDTVTTLALEVHNGTTRTITPTVNVAGSGWGPRPFVFDSLGDGTVNLYWGADATSRSTPTLTTTGGPVTQHASDNCVAQIEVDNGADSSAHRFDIAILRIISLP